MVVGEVVTVARQETQQVLYGYDVVVVGSPAAELRAAAAVNADLIAQETRDAMAAHRAAHAVAAAR
jgi:hypothetical protein